MTIDYESHVQKALLGVIRGVLQQVKESGLPGEHHLYISFAPYCNGVKIAEYLKKSHPEELTIILQHQFWDLEVNDKTFSVTLSFNNVPERLTIPYAAITEFYDPSVKFGLKFNLQENTLLNSPDHSLNGGSASPAEDTNVVALDTFRNKKK